VAIRSSRLTFANLVARRAFTLNVPRAADAAAVDFLGIVSGRDDPVKLARAGFEAGPGAVVEAPILGGCPVNVECRLVERLDLGTHSWFVGEIVEVHVDEACLDAGGKVDLAALDPLVYATSCRQYHRIGADLGRAFEIGRSRDDGGNRGR
jgi:flavin reductase (DIM6/NTAB) family NADH-FMN oxidoreductase RutF